MRIVIDMQGAQGPATGASDAELVLLLAQAIVRNRGEHQVLLAASGFDADGVDRLRTAFAGLLPAQDIRVWYAAGPVREGEDGNASRSAVARCLRGAFLQALRPDVLLVTGPFAGFSSDATTLPDEAAGRIPTVVLLQETDPPAGPQGAAPARWQAFLQARLQMVAQAGASLRLTRREGGAPQLRMNDRPPPGAERDGADWDAVGRQALSALASVAHPPGAEGHPVRELVYRISHLRNLRLGEADVQFASRAIAANHPVKRMPHLYVDISGVMREDFKTGIQRVTRSVLAAMLGRPPTGFRVVPVYAVPGKHGFLQADSYLWRLQHQQPPAVEDRPIEAQPGDIFLALDFVHWMAVAQRQTLMWMRNHGVRVYFVVYDLLPVRFPQFFPDGAAEGHEEWLRIVAGFDGAMCISRSVQQDLDDWLQSSGNLRPGRFKSGWFHLGADVEASQPSLGLPPDGEEVLALLAAAPTFLMVGTLEPRKGYRHVLAAFETLWAQGHEVNLAIVGKPGWMMEDFAESLRQHPELNRRLFWAGWASDEYLERIYRSSSCLIAASECEGFGLPLIEAARHGLPVIARDTPVFREVAGEHAFLFQDSTPDELAKALAHWVALHGEELHPSSEKMPWLTWEQSARQLLANIC